MHVTEFHHIGHESVLREDEDTVLSSKSHVNLPNYLFFLMCVQNRNLNKTKHLFFPLVPKTKISKWISAGKDLCFLSTFVPVLLCYMSAKWSDWVELMDTAAWCFPQRHSLSCFLCCLAEYGAQHAVVEPWRATRGSRDHRDAPLPGAGAGADLPTGREAALPHLQRLVHGPPVAPVIIYLKITRRNI